MGVGDYISTGNRFRLTYVGSPTLTYMGFDILVTSLKGLCRLLKKNSVDLKIVLHQYKSMYSDYDYVNSSPTFLI